MFTKITSRTYALPELEGIQYERTITDSINSQDSQDKINSNINGEMNIMTSVNVEIIESNKPEEFNKIETKKDSRKQAKNQPFPESSYTVTNDDKATPTLTLLATRIMKFMWDNGKVQIGNSELDFEKGIFNMPLPHDMYHAFFMKGHALNKGEMNILVQLRNIQSEKENETNLRQSYVKDAMTDINGVPHYHMLISDRLLANKDQKELIATVTRLCGVIMYRAALDIDGKPMTTNAINNRQYTKAFAVAMEKVSLKAEKSKRSLGWSIISVSKEQQAAIEADVSVKPIMSIFKSKLETSPTPENDDEKDSRLPVVSYACSPIPDTDNPKKFGTCMQFKTDRIIKGKIAPCLDCEQPFVAYTDLRDAFKKASQIKS